MIRLLSGPDFNFGDKQVNYFENGFRSLINFGFKGDANRTYDNLFTAYSNQLHSESYKGITVMNYISSHDDGYPFDKNRKRTFESATKLMLSPGMAQIYYGDEVARPLEIDGAEGDANLRGMMNWDENEQQELLEHWQKLGQFRRHHPAVGAGNHITISQEPYAFIRTYVKGSKLDRIIVGLDLPKETITLKLNDYFNDGEMLYDRYSNKYYTVNYGGVEIKTDAGIVLLERTR